MNESEGLTNSRTGFKNNVIMLMKYILYAGIATAVDMSVLYFFTSIISLYYLISAVIAYICGMITNYILNKYLTFKNTSNRFMVQFSLFTIVALIGLALNELILFICVQYFNIWYIYAKVVSVLIVMFWSFVGHKKLTFNIKILN